MLPSSPYLVIKNRKTSKKSYLSEAFKHVQQSPGYIDIIFSNKNFI